MKAASIERDNCIAQSMYLVCHVWCLLDHTSHDLSKAEVGQNTGIWYYSTCKVLLNPLIVKFLTIFGKLFLALPFFT